MTVKYTRTMKHRRRRVVGLLLVALAAVIFFVSGDIGQEQPAATNEPVNNSQEQTATGEALTTLDTIAVKGRAPKTGYTRSQFGSGWERVGSCDMRNIILARDLTGTKISDDCKVMRGTLHDPYTGEVIEFVRGPDTSDDVQIDHVVALSNAWQTGAQQLTSEQRAKLANDPLELLAVKGEANQQKGDGDAATWLPANKAFRCQYVARQVAVKAKYGLWVTPPEKQAMQSILAKCPGQRLPVEK